MSNPFFKNTGPHNIKKLISSIKLKINNLSDEKINDIKDLHSSIKGDITFFHSKKYSEVARMTKASYCITTENLKSFLPNSCNTIISDNVLLHTAQLTKIFYPDSVTDDYDTTVKDINNTEYKDNVKFGKNILIGKNVKIGSNTSIGNNTTIEHDVYVGKNCLIGSNITLKNTIIGDNVVIQDGCKIGVKGFGFVPLKDKNFRFPHIGRVLLNNNVELGANCTIDRGSIGDTVIGENTFLDNQVHIAHNVKIGKNCIITAQVGFAGSTTIGNRVSIGGQAGISGHLNIGNNVQIGGGSGVIKNIPDNSKVMGYPAKNIRSFLKNEN